MYAEVLIPVKLGNNEVSQLTYAIPNELSSSTHVGSVVRIPLRNRQYTGVITELHQRSLSFTARDILSLQDGGALLADWQIKLAQDLASYYHCPFYKILKLMLPGKLWRAKRAIPRIKMYKKTGNKLTGHYGPKQSALIKLFKQRNQWSRTELKEFSLATIKSLIKKGWIREFEGEIKGSQHNLNTTKTIKKLTEKQHHIVSEIINSQEKKFLIHGVTGSGKTEIYLRLAEHTIKQGKQAMILVPEIALTPQLIDYFATTFGEKIAVLHSKLSLGEREREWWRIQTGEAHVIIGSRSAIFAPAHKLDMVIIDEEHEWSYKQDKTPHYHARTVAEKISALTNAKIILGSATPSVETYHAAQNGKIKLFTLSERINKSELPPVQLIDMREELKKGNFSPLSDALSASLHDTLKAGNQAILFLNRRGYSSSILCRNCGLTSTCTQCDVNLTYHRFRNGLEKLVCHHCGFNQNMPLTCPQCNSASIKTVGLGTQQVEDELQKRFPTARILRADRDTTSTKDSFKKIYHSFKAGDADILIGTQMVSKGLDLPNVTLVGVVLADIGLHIPDFRAGERAFQLLTQVAGRSGRAEKQGKVIIQTYNPEHPSLQAASHHDYQTFYNEEITQRKTFKNPPLERIIKLTFRHEEQKKCTTAAADLQKALDPHLKGHQLTSAPALIPRRHNKYRWHVFLQGEKPQDILAKITPTSLKNWIIDVDPITMG